MTYNAIKLLAILENDFLNNDKAFSTGRRNNDAVDMSIIAWCLDKEPTEVLAKIEDNQGGWSETQQELVREHMERVAEYLPRWGTRGTMEAMDYSINY